MKIYLDNDEDKGEARKVVYIQQDGNKHIHDDMATIIEALVSYGYTEEVVKAGFVAKCIHWGCLGFDGFDGVNDVNMREEKEGEWE